MKEFKNIIEIALSINSAATRKVFLLDNISKFPEFISKVKKIQFSIINVETRLGATYFRIKRHDNDKEMTGLVSECYDKIQNGAWMEYHNEKYVKRKLEL